MSVGFLTFALAGTLAGRAGAMSILVNSFAAPHPSVEQINDAAANFSGMPTPLFNPIDLIAKYEVVDDDLAFVEGVDDSFVFAPLATGFGDDTAHGTWTLDPFSDSEVYYWLVGSAGEWNLYAWVEDDVQMAVPASEIVDFWTDGRGLSNISFYGAAPIPEPTSVVLFCAGSAVVAWRVRRRLQA